MISGDVLKYRKGLLMRECYETAIFGSSEFSLTLPIDGFVVLRSGFFIRLRGKITTYAREARLPSLFGHVREVTAGGLMAYGADTEALFYGAASYVDKILKGANPAELPISQATKFNLTVNLKTAKALGVTFPPSILLRATEVIE